MLAELPLADDIVLIEDTINKAKILLHKVEVATQHIGLFLNVDKTKVIYFNPSTNNTISTANGDEIEKVEAFL